MMWRIPWHRSTLHRPVDNTVSIIPAHKSSSPAHRWACKNDLHPYMSTPALIRRLVHQASTMQLLICFFHQPPIHAGLIRAGRGLAYADEAGHPTCCKACNLRFYVRTLRYARALARPSELQSTACVMELVWAPVGPARAFYAADLNRASTGCPTAESAVL
jgi:hypothetical protein